MSEQLACAKCGSAKVVSNLKVRDLGDYNTPADLSVMLYENPDALIFKETFLCTLTARVCGDCGYAELYAAQPGELYAAYERSKQPRD